MDQRKFALLEALKVGALHAGEIRLYRRAKLPGLFEQRTRLNAEVAEEAVRDGLIEIVRVEMVGKTAVEWVRVTQKGLDLLLQSESPVRALEELRAVLTLNQQGLPTWLADLQTQLDALTGRFMTEVVQIRTQIDHLAQRTLAAIERSQAMEAPTTIAWAQDAFDVLDRRKQVGLGDRCSLADLFAALQKQHAELTLKEYHHGLKRLRERQLLALYPDVPNGASPGPEYALLDGATVYYYVARVRE